MRLFSSNTSSRANIWILRGSGRRVSAALAALAVVASLAAAPAGAQDQVDKTINAQVKTDKAASASQKRIDKIKDATSDAAVKYAQAKDEADSLEKYNKQLSAQVQSQEENIASIQEQLDGIEKTTREVQPLMEHMIASLAQFVSLDVPFLPKVRHDRVARLQGIMGRSDVTVSEKYRQILEAYQIELDYGRTLGAYRGTLGEGANARTVQFVRVGRVSLMYQTLDGSETGYWDQNQHKWVVDNSYAADVKQALDVAEDKGQPELLTIPVPAPQEIHS